MKILYHGTDRKFKDFDFKLAKPNKDFGKGFYLTSNRKQAVQWAKNRNFYNFYIMSYELDDDTYQKLSKRELMCYNKDWLDYILACRFDGYEERSCDLVLDRIADSLRGDEITDLLEQYKRKKVSSDFVLEKIKWGRLNDQWCFKTPCGVTALRLKSIMHSYMNTNGRWENKYEYTA